MKLNEELFNNRWNTYAIYLKESNKPLFIFHKLSDDEASKYLKEDVNDNFELYRLNDDENDFDKVLKECDNIDEVNYMSMLLEEEDPYTTLGLNKNATPEQIKNAYMKKAKQAYDKKAKNLGDEQANQEADEINTAYSAVKGEKDANGGEPSWRKMYKTSKGPDKIAKKLVKKYAFDGDVHDETDKAIKGFSKKMINNQSKEFKKDVNNIMTNPYDTFVNIMKKNGEKQKGKYNKTLNKTIGNRQSFSSYVNKLNNPTSRDEKKSEEIKNKIKQKKNFSNDDLAYIAATI